jgi:hypothetical protein
MDKLANLLNTLYEKKESIKNYTIPQLKDCLKNETQRKENCSMCHKLLEENKALIHLFTTIMNSETVCST